MPAFRTQTFGKEERISSKILIDKLFGGGKSRSLVAYPVRLVYMKTERKEPGEPVASILISVPKRCFKLAVNRNRVKRQIREAYRKNKHLVRPAEGEGVAIAFIWFEKNLLKTSDVERRIVKLLRRMSENL
ncbi:MAG: ribonuclease P protein component [Prevotellaceae bacterium]|nr:ribonuclease P protein component [Prevotella sp.]MDD7258040.1 ribonuclease P protein component [Prevotellaceae bacterium]MDY6130546.1 ribonuclease P protein component [Prevotella sp.]